jgi:hypothetical protein
MDTKSLEGIYCLDIGYIQYWLGQYIVLPHIGLGLILYWPIQGEVVWVPVLNCACANVIMLLLLLLLLLVLAVLLLLATKVQLGGKQA